MEKETQPFGWEVQVFICDRIIKEEWNSEVKTFAYRGCDRRQAERRALMKPHAYKVKQTIPLTEKEWISAYGIGRT